MNNKRLAAWPNGFEFKRGISRFLLLSVAAMLGMMSSFLAQAAGSELKELGFSVLPGNQVEVYLAFSGEAPDPVSFTTENPARIILDFPGVMLDLEQKTKTVGIGSLTTITAVEANNRTRVVLSLVRSVGFDTLHSGQRLIIAIGKQAPLPEQSMTEELLPAFVPEGSPVFKQDEGVQAIDFRRGESGSGRIVVTLANPETEVHLAKEGKKIVAEFQDVELPERLDRKLDVLDFATPVVSIDTRTQGDKVRMEITTAGEAEHIAYQTGQEYIIEIKPVIPEPKKELDLTEKTYSGERLSLNFQDIEVKAVLNLLAEFTKLNIVASQRVKGRVTLRLKNVPWDQALDIILESQGLGMQRIGNVILVDDAIVLEDRERQRLEARKKIEEVEPLYTEFIRLSYSDAAEIKALLHNEKTGESSYSFLSERGSVSIDARTNTLLIQDTAERLEEIRRLVLELDTPVRQVLIEARVVIASDDFAKELGVKFGQSSNASFGANRDWGVVTGGKLEGDTLFPGSTSFNTDEKENFIIDMPAAGILNPLANPAAFGLAVGKIGTYMLQLELSALQEEGRGEIIASPRVVTANQQTAMIHQGVERAYLTAGGVGSAGTVEYREALLKLEVKPKITPDNRVIMDLKVTKDEPRSENEFNKRQVETKVLVDNGETVVLGGVYEQSTTQSVERVPFFGELPFVGALFRNTQNIDQKRELLIFVTPKILQEKSS